MGDFFKGWRRKIGCVTLVMALLGVIGSMWSIVIEDFSHRTMCGASHDLRGIKEPRSGMGEATGNGWPASASAFCKTSVWVGITEEFRRPF